MDRAPWVNERFMSGWKGLNWVEHVLLMKVWSAINIAQPKSFSAGIQKLIQRYNKCIVLQGDCVKKWYVKLITVTSIKAVKCFLLLLFDSPSYITMRGSKNMKFRTLVNCYRLQPLTCVNPDLRNTVRRKLNKARRWMLRQNSDYECRPLYQISNLLCSSTLESSFAPRRYHTIIRTVLLIG